MAEPTIILDPARARALEEAVARGEVASLEEGVLAALDAWLLERAISQTSDARLQALWREGEESGPASELDVADLKAEARRRLGT
jgi:Arc/MetJ-type ribon-helix-helix transcriptional regulator